MSDNHLPGTFPRKIGVVDDSVIMLVDYMTNDFDAAKATAIQKNGILYNRGGTYQVVFQEYWFVGEYEQAMAAHRFAVEQDELDRQGQMSFFR